MNRHEMITGILNGVDPLPDEIIRRRKFWGFAWRFAFFMAWTVGAGYALAGWAGAL